MSVHRRVARRRPGGSGGKPAGSREHGAHPPPPPGRGPPARGGRGGGGGGERGGGGGGGAPPGPRARKPPRLPQRPAATFGGAHGAHALRPVATRRRAVPAQMPREIPPGWPAPSPAGAVDFYTSAERGRPAPVLVVSLQRPRRPAPNCAGFVRYDEPPGRPAEGGGG